MMFSEYGNTLLYALIILVFGIVLGRVWAYLRSAGAGPPPDRISPGHSSHYIMGLNYLISNKRNLAIKEFTKAAKENVWAPEIYITLGNLYREKGLVQKAIQIHQGVLHRSDIPRQEKLQALYCLGLDFKKGGLVDRALATFKDLIREDPANVHAMMVLGKLYEELKNWDAAYHTIEKTSRTKEERLELSFLKNEMGLDLLRADKLKEAQKRFQEAVQLNQDFFPARIYLGDIQMKQGKTAAAVKLWEAFAEGYKKKAHLVFGRIETGYKLLGEVDKLSAFCRRFLENNAGEWKLYLILSGLELDRGSRERALELMFQAMDRKPASMAVHRRILKSIIAEEADSETLKAYLSRLESAEISDERYICLQCRYQSSEHLWNCPHCHAWDSLIEA
jgi:lipopolysaccharide biosynthesis regulator YciM